jgi:probable rRNA maturation factor
MTDAAADLDIEVTIPCAAWRKMCPEAEAMAAETARFALWAALRQRRVVDAVHPVVGIRLTDDAEQQRLNLVYREKDASTNVLSFPLADLAEPPPPGSLLLLGDVVLAFETVRREAAEQHRPFADHFRHLVVHGVLHLLGFDHDNDADAVIMEEREVGILAGLGVPDPYRGTM